MKRAEFIVLAAVSVFAQLMGSQVGTLSAQELYQKGTEVVSREVLEKDWNECQYEATKVVYSGSFSPGNQEVAGLAILAERTRIKDLTEKCMKVKGYKTKD